MHDVEKEKEYAQC